MSYISLVLAHLYYSIKGINIIQSSHLSPAEEPTDQSCPIEGQVFTECGTACPPTCAESGPKFCTLQCVVGCQCPAGTVLDEVANRCVPVEKCSTCSCMHKHSVHIRMVDITRMNAKAQFVQWERSLSLSSSYTYHLWNGAMLHSIPLLHCRARLQCSAVSPPRLPQPCGS